MLPRRGAVKQIGGNNTKAAAGNLRKLGESPRPLRRCVEKRNSFAPHTAVFIAFRRDKLR